jgi:hypothetical protein
MPSFGANDFLSLGIEVRNHFLVSSFVPVPRLVQAFKVIFLSNIAFVHFFRFYIFNIAYLNALKMHF